ncbi:MAG: hypothetical protein ACYC1M_01695 [Armatimonadota bacterium]
MKRGFLVLLAILLLIGFTGCNKKQYNTYVSDGSEYTLQYPAIWRVVNDKQKLHEVMTKLNTSKETEIGKDTVVDVILISKGAIGMVLRSTAPKDTTEKQALDSMKTLAKQLEVKHNLANIKSRKINSKDFLIVTNPDSSYVSAYCLNNGRMYTFMFRCMNGKTPNWEVMISNCINSISFQDRDITAAKDELASHKSGFFSGLWQGYLIIFRWIAVSIWSFDLYAKNNTGTGYLAGFVIGVLFFATHMINSRKGH